MVETRTFTVETVVSPRLLEKNSRSGRKPRQRKIAVGDLGNGFTNGVSGDIVGTARNPIDPKLGPPANYGGPTKTHALLAGSPAIDHGDNAAIPLTDQRGFPRRKDGNGDGIAIVDIGAFER